MSGLRGKWGRKMLKGIFIGWILGCISHYFDKKYFEDEVDFWKNEVKKAREVQNARNDLSSRTH